MIPKGSQRAGGCSGRTSFRCASTATNATPSMRWPNAPAFPSAPCSDTRRSKSTRPGGAPSNRRPPGLRPSTGRPRQNWLEYQPVSTPRPSGTLPDRQHRKWPSGTSANCASPSCARSARNLKTPPSTRTESHQPGTVGSIQRQKELLALLFGSGAEFVNPLTPTVRYGVP